MTQSTVGSAELSHLLAKTREAESTGFGALSTGEALAAALILNRTDWLIAMDYTIAQALERVGPEWVRLIPAVAAQFKQERHAAADKAAEERRDRELSDFLASQGEAKELRFVATYVTSGNAPGYRDVSLSLNLRPMGESLKSFRATISIAPQDGEKVVGAITEVHRFAWRNGNPIDLNPEEARPAWIDGRG